MIVFIHIPKTGGNTLNRAAKHIADTRALIINSEIQLDRKVAEVPPGQPLDLDYIGGHVRLGYVKSLLAERNPTLRPRYATLLRDPVARAFSLYLFVLRVTNALPHLTRAVQGRDFAYFLDYAYDHAHWHLHDAQAWLLCGERSAPLAKEAISNDFSVVGTTESWDRFYRAVRGLNGLPFPEDVSGFLGNIAPRASEASDINQGSKPADWREVIGAASIRKLERLNEADFELYDHVARKAGGLIVNDLESPPGGGAMPSHRLAQLVQHHAGPVERATRADERCGTFPANASGFARPPRRVLICDFDFFSTVGGGQAFYRRMVERNPGASFFYPSRGPDLVLEADGRLPGNARPFIMGNTAGEDVPSVLGDSVPDMTLHHARLLANIAAAVQGETFDVVDVPSFFPAAHLVRPIFTCFGVAAERVALSMLGWNSVSCRAGYDDLSEVAAVIEAQEIACADAADIRYTISHLEQSLQSRGDLPVLQVDMHDFIEEFPLPAAVPPGTGAPDLWYVGRLDGAKGPDIFIELAARMPRHLYGRCFLAGPDNVWEAGARWSDHVLSLARRRGVDATWLGVLPDADVRQRAYQGRSVVVVPSRTDSFNYVALEAVLNGCPVLLSSRTGASGFLASEHPALLPAIMDPEDLEGSARQLRGILESYETVAGRLRHTLRIDPFVRPRRDSMADIYMAVPERTRDADARAAELTALLRTRIPLMSEAARQLRRVPASGKPRPRASIIIPTFDRPQLLAPALASLARQTLQDFEVIVVDDGSSDPAAIQRLVDSYAPWARLKRVGNSGEAGAVNRGLEEAQGEFLGFLSDDDAFHPELLEQAVLALEECPEALGVYPHWEVIDTAGAAVELHRVPAFDRRLMLRAHWCLPGVGAIVRRSAVAAIGGRDITFRFVSDFDFWLRLTAHGPLLQIPHKLAYWRLHQSNLTNSNRHREMADERIRLLDRLFADPEEQARSAADRRTAYAAAHLCAAALLNRSDEARALQHLSSAAELDGDLCRDLPPNMAGYPPFWPDGYQQALGW